MITLLFNIPAATEPEEVVKVLYGYHDENGDWVEGGGYYTEIPPGGIMPASKNGGGKSIVHCVVSGATYQQIMDIASDQRPVWQDFGSQDLLPIANPDYDPEIPPTIIVDDEEVPNPDYEPPLIANVYTPVNNSVWNFLPDRPVYDNSDPPVQIGTEPQEYLHEYQGQAHWPKKGEA